MSDAKKFLEGEESAESFLSNSETVMNSELDRVGPGVDDVTFSDFDNDKFKVRLSN